MKFFCTYGDMKYENEKKRILDEAERTLQFDGLFAYGPCDLSERVKASILMSYSRGGGLWVWKPEVILKTMQSLKDGDILVYCDAGCTLAKSKEWKRLWGILGEYDIVAQRLFQKNEKWTRKEIVDYFHFGDTSWMKCYQYQATIILKVSEFTRSFVEEWLDVMLRFPVFVMDVNGYEREMQYDAFVENRHDQAVYSALLYKYMVRTQTCKKIYTMWERMEDYDFFHKQAIRATRIKTGVSQESKAKQWLKRIVKHSIIRPLYYAPLQKLYFGKFIKEMKNEKEY